MNHCDLIILCTPISTVIAEASEIHKLSEKLASHTPKPLIIMDVASVKEKIAEEFSKMSSSTIEFIATHPMAGSEKQGFEHSKANLFVSATWVICPHEKNTDSTKTKIQTLTEFMGSKYLEQDAVEHDHQTALISHLPGIISRELYKFVNQQDPKSLEIVGRRFRAMTRLAHSNPRMRAEIEQFNHKNIHYYLGLWVDNLKRRSHV